MLLIRPISGTDFPALLTMAQESGAGFTSLPLDEQKLAHKIVHSEQSFAADIQKPGDQGYLFVLEDTATGEILGASGIEAAVGLSNPLYHFHKSTVVHQCKELDIFNPVEVLTVGNDYTGATEICTLFLREPFRVGLNGRFLSKVRFMFMAEQPQRFSKLVIAEMRGAADEQGQPPFWHWLRKSFFNMDFSKADYLIGVGNKGFIADLMPRYPIYVDLLPEAARKVIGQVHENTVPALKLLENEGFMHRGYVDLFDAGPTVEAQLKQIKSVRQSHRAKVVITQDEALRKGQYQLAVCNCESREFRATVTDDCRFDPDTHSLYMSPAMADLLKVNEDELVRYLNLDKGAK
ncbi:arginine N-succinyltransferase [Shewanella sedimentimangrovi]|uniref:Arginine N-succinyltransferase n=1 Tax=Shewanella sedimentimangrovi TaxID=2814293 RepID=A0ABX7QY04_9GAMM|nr:arginine N-succinyltransferase [Shewanella sedimentimangrovi]QSX35683.1 arginine N-succinyltransferase [Shewanella sedimentimangrovi]